MNDERDPSRQKEADADSEVLLTAFSRGDDSALGRLVEREAPLLQRHIERKMPAHLLARVGVSDIIQQTSIELIALRERFENRGYGAFRALLKLVAERVLANAIEREHAARRDVQREAARREVSIDSSEASTLLQRLAGKADTPSRVAMRREDIDAMKACLAKLTDRDREIVRLVDYDRLPYDEVARRLDVSASAAMKRHSRAIEKLRRLMGPGVSGVGDG